MAEQTPAAFPRTPGADFLTGAIVALATPLTEDGKLDPLGLERLLERVAAHPISAISPTGTTGEGPLLARRLRVEVAGSVAAAVGDRLAVIPGVVATNLEEALADLDAYAGAGADAALVSPPFYYPLVPGDVEAWYRRLLASSPLPLVLYNIPQMTKVQIAPEVVTALAGEAGAIGLKDSGGDLEHFSRLLAAVAPETPFSLLTGTDTMLVPSVQLGAAGTIAASLNLVPELGTSILAHLAAGDTAVAVAEQRRLLAIVDAVRRAGAPRAWKLAVALAGVCEQWPAAPQQPISPRAAEALRAELAQLGVAGVTGVS